MATDQTTNQVTLADYVEQLIEKLDGEVFGSLTNLERVILKESLFDTFGRKLQMYREDLIFEGRDTPLLRDLYEVLKVQTYEVCADLARELWLYFDQTTDSPQALRVL